MRSRSGTPPYHHFGTYWSYIYWNINRPSRPADYGFTRYVTRTKVSDLASEATAQWLGYYKNNIDINGFNFKLTNSDYTTSGLWTIVLGFLTKLQGTYSLDTSVVTILDIMAPTYLTRFSAPISSEIQLTQSYVEDKGYLIKGSYENPAYVKLRDLVPSAYFVSDKVICSFNGNLEISRLTTNQGQFFNNDTMTTDHSFVTSITKDWWGKNVDDSLKLMHSAAEFSTDMTDGKSHDWYAGYPKIIGGLNYFRELDPTGGKKYMVDVWSYADVPVLSRQLVHTKPYEGFVPNVKKQGSLYTMEFDDIAATAPTSSVKFDCYEEGIWDKEKTKTTNPHLSVAAGIPIIKVKNGNTYKIKVEALSSSPQIYFWLAKNAFAATGNPDADTNAVNLQTENPSLTAAGNKGVRLNMTQATSTGGCIVTYTAQEDGYIYAKWGKSTTEPGGSVRITEATEIIIS